MNYETFKELLLKCNFETARHSNLNVKRRNESFILIEKEGLAIIPFVFQMMREGLDNNEEPYHEFFMLLAYILKFSPIKHENSGYIGLMRADWLAWASNNGY